MRQLQREEGHTCSGRAWHARQEFAGSQQHQSAARSLPNSFFVKNEAELNYGLNQNKLVNVYDGRGYRIGRLTHSKAMLLPEVRTLLQEMGNDYADALEGTDSEGTVFRVTSMTRTHDQQKKLTRSNRNATRGK